MSKRDPGQITLRFLAHVPEWVLTAAENYKKKATKM